MDRKSGEVQPGMGELSKTRFMRSYARRLTTVVVSAALTVCIFAQGTSADGWRRRAICSDTIPGYAYQTAETVQRATVASSAADTFSVSEEDQTKKKVFRPLENELMVGDCSLTFLRLQVYSDGNYQLSFRAVNAAPRSDAVYVAEAKKTENGKPNKTVDGPGAPIRHHRITVTVRLFSGAVTAPGENGKRARGVAIAKFSVGPFFLAPGEELPQSFAAVAPISRRQFNDTTHAEFELEVDPPLPVQPAKHAKYSAR
jgi:hypothetical protein